MLALLLLICAAASCPDEKFCFECSTSSAVPHCSRCAFSVYNPVSNACDTRIVPMANCMEYTGSLEAPSCSLCVPGYRVNAKGECERCLVEDCYSCMFDSKRCDACEGGRTLVNEKCSEGRHCPLENCEACDRTNSYCVACIAEHAFDAKGRCVKAPQNCDVLGDKPDICLVCNYNYYITSDGRCLPNSISNAAALIIFWLSFALILVIIGLVYLFTRKKRSGMSGIEAVIYSENLSLDDS